MAWLTLLVYLVGFSPPEHPDLFAYLRSLATFQGNPLEVMIFQMMGLWPMTYLRLLIHERGRPSAWPFILASFGVGAFAILLYVFLRPRPPPPNGPDRRWSWQTATWSAVFLAGGFASLLIYGLGWGDTRAFFERLTETRFVSVMTLDCVLLTAFFIPVWRSRARAV